MRSANGGRQEELESVGHKRYLETNPLHSNEKNFVALTSKKGLMLSAALLGHRASSTRAELGAGIAAMMADEPTHQGTDSQSYLIKGATNITRNVAEKTLGYSDGCRSMEVVCKGCRCKRVGRGETDNG